MSDSTDFVIVGGGVAGALLAPWGQIVTPDYVNWLHSAQPIFATLLVFGVTPNLTL